MKETFDGIFETLSWMKRHAIRHNPAALYSYNIIEEKVKKLQAKYNEGLQKEPVAAKNTEMTALEYLKEKARMCDSAGDCSCTGCLIHTRKGTMMCVDFQQKCPEQAISAVQQWSKEHPRKTIKDDFFETFPNANKLCDGIPDVCAAKLGYLPECPHPNVENCCKECWDTVLKEE